MSETTTVTLLFTDVVGSTRLRQHQGETAAQAIMNAHNQIVRQQIAEHAGQEVKTTGDSFMVAFDSARKGVECAVGVQRALHDYNRRHPAHPVKVRIGLHTGEAIHDGHDLFGTSVDAAARIMGRADGGEILVSDTLKAVLGASKDFGFKQRKRVRLKGFAESWRLWEVAWRSEAEAVASEAAVAAGAASAAGRTPYVGRAEERALLRQAVDRALGTSEGWR
jgi:class 3 adenylate cyclase